jgi:hypothetical protein
VRHARPVKLTESIDWQPLAWADESGQLHRWVIIDRWDEDAKWRDIHSWRTIGDIVVCEAPMMLHIVEIGQMRNERRQSSWTRAWRHPKIANFNKMHFRSKDGTPLIDWKPIYLADDIHADHDAWVDQMAEEGETGRLIHYVTVNVPNREVCVDTKSQLIMIGDEARIAMLCRAPGVWTAYPMTRGACDLYSNPCSYQECCYTDKLVDIEALGIYKSVSTRPEVLVR